MGDVVFRRINGRIVPIRVSKKKREVAKGVGLVGAGVAVSASANYFAGQFVGRSLKKAVGLGDAAISLANVGKVHEALGFSGSSQLNSASARTARISQILSRSQRVSKYLRRGGAAAGIALAGAGVAKIVSPFVNSKEMSPAEEAASSVAGAAVVGAGTYVFKSGVLRGFRRTAQMSFKGL